MTDETKRNSHSQEQELSDRILSSLNQSFSGEETRRWMVALEEDDLTSAEEPIAKGARDSQNSTSMAKVIELLFDNFKRYSFEFNRTLENRELEVFCERPSSMRATAEYMDMGKPIKFCLGTLSTRQYSLIILGEERRIRVFIVPVEYMVGFKPGQTEFAHHLDMKLGADRSASEPVWTIDGQILSIASLPALSRRLFTQLIKVSRGEASFEERFLFNPEEKEAPKAPIDRSFESEMVNPFVKEKDAKPAAYNVAATTEPVRQEAKEDSMAPKWQQSSFGQEYKDPVHAPLGNVAASAAKGDSKLEALAHQEKAPGREPLPPPPQPQSRLTGETIAPSAEESLEARGNNPQFFDATASESKSATSQTGAGDTAEISRKVAHSIKGLFDTLDSSIADLTRLGVEAMHRDDIDAVQGIMKHAKTLKTLRDGVVQISKDWQKTL